MCSHPPPRAVIHNGSWFKKQTDKPTPPPSKELNPVCGSVNHVGLKRDAEIFIRRCWFVKAGGSMTGIVFLVRRRGLSPHPKYPVAQQKFVSLV